VANASFAAETSTASKAVSGTLRVLLLEDDAGDAELALRELCRAGLALDARRVATRADFERALQEAPQLILADFRLPAFDGATALELARVSLPEVPFIFLSGAMGEELAIDMLHRGAADYVLKRHLSKLAPAVRRALAEAEMRRERLRAEAALRRSNRFLRTLSRCNEALVRIDNEEELLSSICRIVVDVGGFAAAWIVDAQRRPWAWHGAVLGPQGEQLTPLLAACVVAGSPCNASAEHSATLMADIGSAPLPEACRHRALALGLRSAICLPLRRNGTIYGLFVITASKPNAFGAEEVALLDELAGDMAFGLATMRLRREEEAVRRRLEKALEETINAIAGTIEARDPYTAGHQRQVAKLAGAIARRLGFDEHIIEGITRGASIHDIGKISVPAEILNRPGKLSALEFDLVCAHPRHGYDIIKDIEFPWPLAEMILQHHERLDGSGYPRGLKGDEILPEARVLAVADVADAMRSHRPYRLARTLDQVIAELRAGSARLYDAAVVEACIEILQADR